MLADKQLTLIFMKATVDILVSSSAMSFVPNLIERGMLKT